MDLARSEKEDELVGHLGPDLLGPDWDPERALANLRAQPEVPIGDALLDQRNLAGIGNVFKSDLCFVGHVDPRTPVGDVPDLPLIVGKAKVLLEANKDRFTRITTGDRRRGFQLWVYGRRGPCLRCGAPVRKADLGPTGQERPAYWCPHASRCWAVELLPGNDAGTANFGPRSFPRLRAIDEVQGERGQRQIEGGCRGAAGEVRPVAGPTRRR